MFNKIVQFKDTDINRQIDEMVSRQCKVDETLTVAVANATASTASNTAQLNALLAQLRIAGLIPS